MKITKGLIIAVIMIVLAVGIAGARGPFTPEESTRAFIQAAMEGNIQWMSYTMTEDSAALLTLYGDANKARSFFNGRGGITRIEQVSNDGNNAVTRVTFGNGSTEQFRLSRRGSGHDWLIVSIIRRN